MPNSLRNAALDHRPDQCRLYRLLKFRYLDPTNNKIRLLPMKAVKIPKSRHRVSKLMPNGV